MTRIVCSALVFTLFCIPSVQAQPSEISIEGPLDILPPFPSPTGKTEEKLENPPRSLNVQDWIKSTEGASDGHAECPGCNFNPYPWDHLYASTEAGVFLIDLPSFSFFQANNALTTTFIDTDDGGIGTNSVSATVGLALGDPLGRGGKLRGELIGFFADEDRDSRNLFTGGLAFQWTAIDGSGGIGVVAADLPTATRRSIEYGQVDLLFKYDLPASSGFMVTPFLGLSYLLLDQRILAADLANAMALSEDLDANYLGGTIGFQVVRRLPRNCTMTFNAGYSLYDLEVDRDAAQVQAGTAIALAQRASRAASQVRLRLEFMHKVGRAQVFFYGGAQYLSDVATVNYAPTLAGLPSTIAFEESWGYTAGGGVRMPF